MFKFVNKTSGSVFVNSCYLRKGESSPWHMNANETFTCQSDSGTLIVKVGEHGIKTIMKEGKLSATFVKERIVEIYEDA